MLASQEDIVPLLSGRNSPLTTLEAKDLLASATHARHAPASSTLPERPKSGEVYVLKTNLPFPKVMRRFFVKGFQARSSKEFPLAANNNNSALIRIRYGALVGSTAIEMWCLKENEAVKLAHFVGEKNNKIEKAAQRACADVDFAKSCLDLMNDFEDLRVLTVKPSLLLLSVRAEMLEQINLIMAADLKQHPAAAAVVSSSSGPGRNKLQGQSVGYETRPFAGGFFQSTLSVADVRLLDTVDSEHPRVEAFSVLHKENALWVHESALDWIVRLCPALSTSPFAYSCPIELTPAFRKRFPLCHWTSPLSIKKPLFQHARAVAAAWPELKPDTLFYLERDLQGAALKSMAQGLRGHSGDAVVNPLVRGANEQGVALEAALEEFCDQTAEEILRAYYERLHALSPFGPPSPPERTEDIRLSPGDITYLPKPDLYLLRGAAVASTLPVTVRLRDATCSLLGCAKDDDEKECEHVRTVRLALKKGLVEGLKEHNQEEEEEEEEEIEVDDFVKKE